MKEERRMILQMIEEGKITADEGVALLEALEKSAKAEENASQADASKAEKQVQAEKDDHERRDKIDAVVVEISRNAERIGNEAATQAASLGNKLGEAVERFISKVKELDFDFDFSFANSPKVEKVIEGTPPQNGTIDLSTINGKVEISGWNRSEYRIIVSGQIRAEDKIEANAILNELVEVEQSENMLRVGVEQRRGAKLSLEIFLPNDIMNNLIVKTSNGAINIEDIQVNGAKLETFNGAISISDVKGSDVYCHTSNGRVKIEGSKIEALYAKTTNGPIRIDGILGKVKCYTSNGGIRYTAEEAREGELYLETKNGPIEVKLPIEGLAVQGDLTTNYGRLDCTLPKMEIISVSKEIAHRQLRFQSIDQSGAPLTIICKTSNGGIRIHPNFD